MLVRFRQSHRRHKVATVANARRDGRVVQEIMAYLGSIDTAAMASNTLQSIYARDLFWEKAAPKLKDLDDRIGPDAMGACASPSTPASPGARRPNAPNSTRGTKLTSGLGRPTKSRSLLPPRS
jgi:hypothetical protein